MWLLTEIVAYCVVALVAGILLYLWLPQNTRKRKEAIARLEKALGERDKGKESSSRHTRAPVKASQANPRTWKHERVNAFYYSYILPHRDLLAHSGYLRHIDALLSLLEMHGECPSVVAFGKDNDGGPPDLYRLLSNITLLDHSLNVAEKMVEHMVRRGVKDLEMSLGKLMVAALGHDIGKIPRLVQAGHYAKGDHAYISYLVLKNAILVEPFPQRDEILKAVKEHHYRVEDGLGGLLREADHAAREMEAESLGKKLGLAIGPEPQMPGSGSKTGLSAHEDKPAKAGRPALIDLDWLDLEEFLEFVEPYINVENDGRFKAFSLSNGLVYLMLSLVSETVIKLAEKRNHPEVLVGCETIEKKRSIEYTVKTMLAHAGHIPSFIGDGYSGARFALYDKHGKKLTAGIYMPVSASAFKVPLPELERRRRSCPFLSRIADAQPKTGSKSVST